jgi:D-alanyl-D-alanine carboxypeptidase/D-alanyl-D-alanine-endopeptidase (penicillin-binding protein 4)
LRPRWSVSLMVFSGLIIIAALSFVPYSLKIRQRDARPIVTRSFATYAADVETSAIEKPLFDVAAWYAARGEELERHGVLIETLDGKHTLASLNADVTFNPASLSKLATSLAALKRFGANYRFRIRVYLDGATENGTFRGDLYVASDDPLFGDIQASLIVNDLRRKFGIKRAMGTLFVAPGLCFNFTDAPAEAAARLNRALKLGPMKTAVAAPPDTEPTFTIDSYRLRDVLLYMNAHSSNFVADRLAALVGGPAEIQRLLAEQISIPNHQLLFESGSGLGHNRLTPRGIVAILRALVEELQRQGLDPEDILPFAGTDAGTLRHRLRGTPLEGALVGKTGTLTTIDGGMASLAGIVYTNDYGLVLFALLNQGPRVWESRQMEDELLTELLATHSLPRASLKSFTRRQLLPSLSEMDGTKESGE